MFKGWEVFLKPQPCFQFLYLIPDLSLDLMMSSPMSSQQTPPKPSQHLYLTQVDSVQSFFEEERPEPRLKSREGARLLYCRAGGVASSYEKMVEQTLFVR